MGKAILFCMKKNCDIEIQLFTNVCPTPLVYWVQALGDPYFTSILDNGTNEYSLPGERYILM
jgi:hypothetical protein